MARQLQAIAASTWGKLVQAGDLRLLVTFAPVRTKRSPQAPPLRESGIDILYMSPNGLVGSNRMDPQVVRIRHDTFHAAVLATDQ